MRNTSLGISPALDSARDQSMVNVDCKLHHNHRVFLLRCAVTDISKRDLGTKGGSRTVSSCRLRSKGRTLTFRSCHVYIRQGCCVLDSIRACTLVCGTSTYVVFDHLFRVLIRITHTTHNSQLSHFLVSLIRNNTTRMLLSNTGTDDRLRILLGFKQRKSTVRSVRYESYHSLELPQNNLLFD